ncbi:DENN domain-containing protein 1B isoform X2 [Erpetoichthys calabaricus]|uniref:DENN domain containing 1C n=1 Tax=Erpetoichthys calabaricus TaxID=27687 RepID=A0A8C4XFJ4_ERPCA|nr:DENN domain-containing protein 1B isoform X2 [Erpetoichthys calabaricus]
MGSRIKENPERTFYWFFEALSPIAKDKDPEVLLQFPEDFNDEESLQILPQFCFPYDVERVRDAHVVQNFTFVLTDLEGNQRFGFCRLTTGSKSCLCILSYLPWFEVFYKLLNSLADYLTKGQKNETLQLLSVLYDHSVPQEGNPIILQFLPYFIAPDAGSLPTIPENRNLTELVVSMDVDNMLNLYASLLFERRIILTSCKLSTLTACVHASTAMLYPMYWQHIYIPVIPPQLLDYCCAPMPYLIGVHSSLIEKVRSKALDDVVIINIDTNMLESPFQDRSKLPMDIMSQLKMKLKKQSSSTGDGVARAFLRAQALLFGSYREALIAEADGQIAFNEEAFLNHGSDSMRAFLQDAVHLQLFKQFIDNRLEKLNAGQGFSDIFEEEITRCSLQTGGNKSCQHFVENLKKGSGVLIHTVKSRANPTVKNIYKYAKGHAKLGLKEMKSRLRNKDEERHLHRGGSLRLDQQLAPQLQRRVQSDCLQSRLPITQHFGQSRPRRPTRRYTSPLEEGTTVQEPDMCGLDLDSDDRCHDDREQMMLDAQSEPLEEIDGFLFSKSGDMDLLGEIFETLNTQSSQERGLLYGTRSLDVFSDSTDYVSRVRSITPSEESLTSPFWRITTDMDWGLEEEDEMSLEASSTEEIASSEPPPAKSEKEPPSPNMLVVPAVPGASSDAGDKLSKRNSGMWDRGVSEDENTRKSAEGNTCVEKSPSASSTSGIPWEIGQQTVEEDAEEPPRLDQAEPESTGHARRPSGEGGSDQPPQEVAAPCPKITPEQEEPPQLASHLSGEERPPVGDPNLRTPRVLSTVALFQSKATEVKFDTYRPALARFYGIKRGVETPQEKVHKAPIADPPHKVKSQTIRLAAELSDQQDGSPAEESMPTLKKVSELKKRFEA